MFAFYGENSRAESGCETISVSFCLGIFTCNEKPNHTSCFDVTSIDYHHASTCCFDDAHQHAEASVHPIIGERTDCFSSFGATMTTFH